MYDVPISVVVVSVTVMVVVWGPRATSRVELESGEVGRSGENGDAVDAGSGGRAFAYAPGGFEGAAAGKLPMASSAVVRGRRKRTRGRERECMENFMVMKFILGW
jgi:hypothetical protein